VRAWSDELNKAGLTMPGVIERSRVIASMPTLSLLTLAALTPPDIDIEYHEIRDLRAEGMPDRAFDLIAIASQSAQIHDAYAVADHFRAKGAAVIMGGLHVTAMPDEALAHASAIVVGEAEALWPRLIEDFRAARLARRYQPDIDEEFDFANAPCPRYDLLDPEKYNRLLVQTSRGCPHRCDFCASSILITRKYKSKPVERVLAEVRAIRALWDQPFIELADDNSFIDRRYARDLCRALAPERLKWFTETDISIADDPELLDLMREAGCRQVLIGLESPTTEGLDGIERRRNWKLRQLSRYERAVIEIQSRGISVDGCFILGLDGDTEATFDAIVDFAERVGLYDVQITVLTPFPGTPLYDRLLREGRIIEPGAWHKCTLFDVNFVPRNMTPERLQSGLLEVAQRLYSAEAIARRRDRFMDQLRERSLRSPFRSAC
jgi:radical SAM superfamily enzyme YgiQ (UPF0313 family)